MSPGSWARVRAALGKLAEAMNVGARTALGAACREMRRVLPPPPSYAWVYGYEAAVVADRAGLLHRPLLHPQAYADAANYGVLVPAWAVPLLGVADTVVRTPQGRLRMVLALAACNRNRALRAQLVTVARLGGPLPLAKAVLARWPHPKRRGRRPWGRRG